MDTERVGYRQKGKEQRRRDGMTKQANGRVGTRYTAGV